MTDPFEQAAEEMATKSPDKAIFARAYAAAFGDQQITTALYIRMRAADLQKQATISSKSLSDYLELEEIYSTFLRDFKRRNPLWFLTLPTYLKEHYAIWLKKHGYPIRKE